MGVGWGYGVVDDQFGKAVGRKRLKIESLGWDGGGAVGATRGVKYSPVTSRFVCVSADRHRRPVERSEADIRSREATPGLEGPTRRPPLAPHTPCHLPLG